MEVASQEDIENNICLCLICGCGVDDVKSRICDNQTSQTEIARQLNVIFILKNVLQMPSNQLHEFLKNYGNPENWISLCDHCTQLTGEAMELHNKIVEITRKLKGHQRIIVENVKSSVDTQGVGSGRSRGTKLRNKDNPKTTVWRETRTFVKSYSYDDLCHGDLCLDAKKLIKNLESRYQNPSYPPTLKGEAELLEDPSLKIKLELSEDNHEDYLNDFSPGTPTQSQDQDDHESPLPSGSDSERSSPEVPLKTIKDHTPPKRKRNRYRHPPVPPSEFTHQCLHCPLKFRFYAQVFAHMHSTHSISGYPCLQPNCTKVLETIKKYSKHRVKHLKPKPPKVPKPRTPKLKKESAEDPQPRVLCDLCGGDFASKNNLKQHMKFVHEKSKVYQKYEVSCHLCGLVVKNVNLRRHLLRRHGDQVEVPARKVKGQDGPTGPASLYKCPVTGCKIEYTRKEGLDKHMEKVHGGGGGDIEDDKLYRFKCKYCGKGFTFKRRLDSHEMMHKNKNLNLRPFICDLCGKGFTTQKYVEYHKIYTHKQAKKYRQEESEKKLRMIS